MGTKYDNTDWSKCAKTCGTTWVVIGVVEDNVAQGNYGVSLPCRGCWVQKREGSTNILRMSIGSPATADLGVELGQTPTTFGAPDGASPLWVPVSDVSQLYFYGTDLDSVDIMYMLG